MKTIQTISKNVVILYKARDYLSKELLLSLYYAYIHTYVNYANLTWVSTIRTKLKKISSQQNDAIRKSTVSKITPFTLFFVNIHFHTLKNFLHRTKFLMYIN